MRSPRVCFRLDLFIRSSDIDDHSEHSHESILSAVRTTLNLNNPDGIVDPVFALLGNAAAKQGLGKITVCPYLAKTYHHFADVVTLFETGP